MVTSQLTMTEKSESSDRVYESNGKNLIKPKIGDVIDKKYKVLKELGEGGFGVVLEVVGFKSSEHYAMKAELTKPDDDEPGLDLEGSVLKRLQGHEHILRHIDEGKLGNHAYLVMQLAGHNLGHFRKCCPQQRFTNGTTVRIAVQCLDAIETVHVAGFLHRDIKPPNFAMGFKDRDKRMVYILDFGLVRRFRQRDGSVRPERPTAGFRGSYQFASVSAHNNGDLGRVDDLWSWVYSMVQMHQGKLPWRKMNGKTKIGQCKDKVKREELMKGMEPEFSMIWDSLLTLKYADEPPYSTYKAWLTKIVQRKGFSEASAFDWEEGGEHYKHTKTVIEKPYGK